VIHDARGYWLKEAGAVAARPPLEGSLDADAVIVGGGYAGLWTAWQLLEREPAARVAVLEADVCGHGPSGRNGGFCEGLWMSLPGLRERFGDAAARAVGDAAEESVAAIGAWCEREGVDAWFRRAGYLMASTAPAQDAAVLEVVEAAAAVGRADRVLALDPEGVQARCASPVFRGGAFVPGDATVHPARLALGLRERLLARGVLLHEHARVRALRVRGAGAVEAETAQGRVRARAAVLAVNAAARGIAPLRARLAVTSSHIVLTEPVPDALEAMGWTGGEAITDGRTFVHYFRTTRDGRVAFGWGGGRPAWGARLHGRTEVDPAVVAQTAAHLRRMLPALAECRITHAWGGPIDVSPSHLPQVGTLPGAPVHYAFGFTGNGVGPCHLAGRVLAALALDRREPETRLALVDPAPARVPPEPLAFAGGAAVRRAFLRKERREEAGEPVDHFTRAICAAPRALRIHVSR
jgi:glycine/D-amino acid oxidase-like deaminating enzyme